MRYSQITNIRIIDVIRKEKFLKYRNKKINEKNKMMIFIIAIPILIGLVWLYLTFCPANTNLKSRLKFELTVFLVEVLGCSAIIYYVYSRFSHGVDGAWWPVISAFYCIFYIPFVLFFAAITRMIIYKRKKIITSKD